MYLIYNLILAHLPSVEKSNGAVLVAALERSHRIVVSTQDFHSCNTSSILVGSTNKDYVSLVVSILSFR